MLKPTQIMETRITTSLLPAMATYQPQDIIKYHLISNTSAWDSIAVTEPLSPPASITRDTR